LTYSDDTADTGWYSNHAATFGDRVAGAREAVGLSQADLARKLGVKLTTLQGWEDDVREPRANRLQMLAGVLNVSIMWLLNGEGQGIPEPSENEPLPGDLSDLLLEMRSLHATLNKSADRLSRLEKRLRKALEEHA